jgi:hypothetical protein
MRSFFIQIRFRSMMRVLVVLSGLLFLNACSLLQPSELDSRTGLFPTFKRADVLISKKFDIDKRKSLILVPDHEYEKTQVQNIGYFDRVVTYKELERLIVDNNLSAKVPTVRGGVGVSNAAKHYKPFLWFKYKMKQKGNKYYDQFILTDPLTMDDIFVTETYSDFEGRGSTDQDNYYPMFNALVAYIKENSKTF